MKKHEPKYIDADELKTQLTEAEWFNKADLFVAYGTVALMPAADVVEVRHGRWILGGEIGWPKWTCTVCGGDGRGDYIFCPCCGAKMEDEQNG